MLFFSFGAAACASGGFTGAFVGDTAGFGGAALGMGAGTGLLATTGDFCLSCLTLTGFGATSVKK